MTKSRQGELTIEPLDRKDFFILCGFAIFLLALFAHALFQPGAVTLGRVEGDARNQFYGWRAFGFGQLKQGHLALWNPYELLGLPFIATLQTGLLYPLAWFSLIFPIGRGVNFSLIAGLFLSGTFTYLWCRRTGIGRTGAIIAGAVYTLSAPQILRVYEGHWSFLGPMTWSPCLLLCAEMLASGGPKGAAVALGVLAAGMQLLSGNPQYAFFAGIGITIYFFMRLWVLRQPLKKAAAAFALYAVMFIGGVLLSGAQTAPALEMLSDSSRKGQLSFEWISQYSLVPEALLSLFAPDIFGSDTGVQYWGRWNLWEMSVYHGAVGLGLIILGFATRRRKMFWSAFVPAVILLLLALGNHGPLLNICYDYLPGFNLFRCPARFLAPFSLFMAMLAGLGIDLVLETASRLSSLDKATQGDEIARTRKRLRIPLIVIGALAALLIGFGAPLAIGLPGIRESWTEFLTYMMENVGPLERLYFHGIVDEAFVRAAMAEAGLSMILSGLLIGAAGMAALLAREGMRLRIIVTLVLIAAAVDFTGFGRRYLKTFDPRDTGLTPGAVAWLKARPQPFRVARAGDYDFPPCEGMEYGFGSLEGFQPHVPSRLNEAYWMLQGEPEVIGRHTTTIRITTLMPSLMMLNLQYFMQSATNPVSNLPGLKVGVYRDERVRIDALPDPWPRAWLVHDLQIARTREEALYELYNLDYERRGLMESADYTGFRLRKPLQKEEIPEVTLIEPNRVEISAAPAADALMIVSDLYYPGWRATVDGRPVDIMRVNYLMRGILLGPGEHKIVFTYAPLSFRLGVACSGAGALLALVALLLPRAIRSRKQEPVQKENVGEEAN